MKFATTFLVALAPFSAWASGLRSQEMEAIAHERMLVDIEDLQPVVIGRDAKIYVTINQTAANGLLTFGDALAAVGPAVNGAATEVTCTAKMSASLVDMQFYLRKALIPDEDGNGNAKDYDCQAASDQNLMSPDIESCSVTNFNDFGDVVVAYFAVIDKTFAQGTTYLIEFRCDITKDNTNYWWNDYCFSEDTTVDVLGKGEVKMSDLAVGDKIRAGESYEPVYAFAHLHKTTTAPYLHISTDSPNAPLEVTAEHLLYVNGKYTAAKDVKVGDILMDGSHTEAKVQKITIKQKAGLYAPLTPSGTLIVNGIQTSAYVSLQKNAQATLKLGNLDTRLSFHSLNHIALSPIRMACMGISSNFCSNEHIDVESGYPPFVSFWFALVQWFEHQALAVQLALLVVFFCVVGPLFLAESILGATFAPAILLCGASIVLRRFVKTQNNASEKVKQL